MSTITFKVSAEEARALRARARAQKQTISAYLRAVALGPKRQTSPGIKVKRHPVSGLLFDAGGSERPQVTREQIKDALADFP